MKKRRFRSVLKAINNYVVFFLTVAFAVSCCMLLFVNTLADSMGLVFNEENIGAAAKITFLNVLLLTLLFGPFNFSFPCLLLCLVRSAVNGFRTQKNSIG